MNAAQRKAPFALLHFRSVLLAVFGAALLAALAASSSPFVTIAAASEAFDNRLAELTPLATGLEVTAIHYPETAGAAGLARDEATREAAARTLAARLPGVGKPVFTLETNILYVLGAGGDSAVRMMVRTDAISHVKVLSQVPGDGVWISNIIAEIEHLKAGGTLRFDTATFGVHRPLSYRIKGVYRALAQSPPTPFWVNFGEDIYPQDPNDSPPGSYVFVSQAQLAPALLLGRGHYANDIAGGGITRVVELPVEQDGMTLAKARALDGRFDRLESQLYTSALGRKIGCSGPTNQRCVVLSSLSSAVILADRNAKAVTVAISLLSDLGTAIALGVAAAAGAFAVRRRRVEAALAYARGKHVAAYAGRTAVEALAPVVVGGLAGFGLAYALTGVFAPDGSTDPGTAWSAAAHASIAVGIALVLLVGTAAFAFLRLYDTGVRKLPWLRYLPWEVPVLAAAIYLLVEIRTGGGMSTDASGATHPTLAVFVFPLLFVAGVAGLAARVVRFLLGRARGSGSGNAPIYLAIRRLAAARGLLVLLSVVSAVALGAFAYADTLAASLDHTTVEKAYMATGSDAQAQILQHAPLPAHFPYPITEVVFGNQAASIGGETGQQVDVILVDPATLAGALHWESDWGPNPAGLIRTLARSPASPLPVIVTPDAARMGRIFIQGKLFPVKILGTVKAFPEMSAGIPLVITSFRALEAVTSRVKLFDPLGVVQTYVWGKGPPLAVERAITASRQLGAYYPSSIETYLTDPNVELATRTFSFMRTMAIAAAVLVLIGLMLYLQARQRSQVIASALARRMGLGAAAESLSLMFELAAILLFAGVLGVGIALASARPVTRHIDPLPQDAPSPIFTIPSGELLEAGAGLVLVAVLAGIVTSRLARRANVSEALRVA